MGLSVVEVVKLVRPVCVFKALCMSSGLVVEVLWVVEGDDGHRMDLCAEQTQRLHLGRTLCVWHVDYTFVALGPADMGKPNTGVTGRALDNGAAGLDLASLFSHLDEEECSPIFDGPAWVHPLGLAVDVSLSELRESFQLDQRGVPHRREDSVVGDRCCGVQLVGHDAVLGGSVQEAFGS